LKRLRERPSTGKIRNQAVGGTTPNHLNGKTEGVGKVCVNAQEQRCFEARRRLGTVNLAEHLRQANEGTKSHWSELTDCHDGGGRQDGEKVGRRKTVKTEWKN